MYTESSVTLASLLLFYGETPILTSKMEQSLVDPVLFLPLLSGVMLVSLAFGRGSFGRGGSHAGDIYIVGRVHVRACTYRCVPCVSSSHHRR